MTWRTDVENCPKDGTPILVVDSYWETRGFSKHSLRIVSWEIINDEFEEEKWGWSYDYDYEYCRHLCVGSFKYWTEIEKPAGLKNYFFSEELSENY